MRSFITLVFAASATLTAAQFTDNGDGTFTCATPNAAYCVGGSLGSNIIIRCSGTVGQPGNCNDNLDGEFPFGVNYSPCWEPSPTSGMAACSKNCVVYGGSGNYNGTFTLPASVCTPATTQSSSMSSTSSTSSTPSTSGSSSIASSVTTTSPVGPSITYTTVTVPCTSGTTTTTPSGPAITTPSSSSVPPTGGSSTAPGNSTVGASTPSNPGGSATATATPVGPTTTKPASFTGAAVSNQVAGVLAAGGLFIAYFL